MQISNNTALKDFGYKLLVVDGSRAHLELLDSWLSGCGFSVVPVCNGYEAIKRFNVEWFDVVLTDICMLSMDGNVLAHILHAIQRDVPIVAMAEPHRQVGPEFDIFLPKPFQVNDLLEVIDSVLLGLYGVASLPQETHSVGTA